MTILKYFGEMYVNIHAESLIYIHVYTGKCTLFICLYIFHMLHILIHFIFSKAHSCVYLQCIHFLYGYYMFEYYLRDLKFIHELTCIFVDRLSTRYKYVYACKVCDVMKCYGLK